MMHTPGPWTVRHDFRSGNGELCIGVSAARIGPKSGAVAWPSGVDDAQELANARLIAAAPDLLAALQHMVDMYQRHFDVMPVAWQTADDIARAAIARATGGQ